MPAEQPLPIELIDAFGAGVYTLMLTWSNGSQRLIARCIVPNNKAATALLSQLTELGRRYLLIRAWPRCWLPEVTCRGHTGDATMRINDDGTLAIERDRMA